MLKEYLFAIIVPFAVVKHNGTQKEYIASIVLTLLGWLPGVLHAWTVVWKEHHRQNPSQAIVFRYLTTFVLRCAVISNVFRVLNNMFAELFTRMFIVLYAHERNDWSVDSTNAIADLYQISDMVKMLMIVTFVGLLKRLWSDYRVIKEYRTDIGWEMTMIFLAVAHISLAVECLRTGKSTLTGNVCMLSLFGSYLVMCIREVYGKQSDEVAEPEEDFPIYHK